MKDLASDISVFTGRCLIAILFLGGAVQKTISPEGTMDLLADWSLPVWFVWPALGFNALTL